MLMLGAGALPPTPPIVFDLRATKASSTSADCRPGIAGEITVCGHPDPDRYRIKPIDGEYQTKPIRAETKLGSGTLSAHGAASPVPGAPPRALVTFSLAF